jgi:hypothetical protein
MQEYNVLSRISTEDSSDEGESDDPDERDRRSLLPQSSRMTRQEEVSSDFDRNVRYDSAVSIGLKLTCIRSQLPQMNL